MRVYMVCIWMPHLAGYRERHLECTLDVGGLTPDWPSMVTYTRMQSAYKFTRMIWTGYVRMRVTIVTNYTAAMNILTLC